MCCMRYCQVIATSSAKLLGPDIIRTDTGTIYKLYPPYEQATAKQQQQPGGRQQQQQQQQQQEDGGYDPFKAWIKTLGQKNAQPAPNTDASPGAAANKDKPTKTVTVTATKEDRISSTTTSSINSKTEAPAKSSTSTLLSSLPLHKRAHGIVVSKIVMMMIKHQQRQHG